MHRGSTFCTGLLVAGLIAGCASAKPTNGATSPPGFDTVAASVGDTDQARLRSSMWQLAVQIHELDRLISREADLASQSDEVADLLAQIQRTADAIEPEQIASTHPDLRASLGAFRREIGTAREGAEKTPPNFYFAGIVSGACVYCHR